MFIESIELKNYRNYGELHMDFDPGTNVLYGDNAQGKTNILEAVYVCDDQVPPRQQGQGDHRIRRGRVPHQDAASQGRCAVPD